MMTVKRVGIRNYIGKEKYNTIYEYMYLLLPILLILGLIFTGCNGGGFNGKTADPNDTDMAKGTWSPIEVDAAVDNPQPAIGEIITYTLSINAIPEIEPQIPEMGSQIKGLRIVDIGGEGPKTIDARRVWKRWYKLQPDFVGPYIIPQAKILYSDPDGKDVEVTAPKIFIEVRSVMNEDEEGGDIRDIKSLEEIKDNLNSIYLYTGIVLLLVIIAFICIRVWIKKRKRVEVEAERAPDEIAIDNLHDLKESEYLEKEDYREFYFRLSEIFRGYIESRFGFPAQECTTEELVPQIEKLKLSRSQKDTVRLLTRWEDLVKFAKHKPNRERAEKDWEQTLNLIIHTGERQPEKEEAGRGK